MARKIKEKRNRPAELAEFGRDVESAENSLGPSRPLERLVPKATAARKYVERGRAARVGPSNEPTESRVVPQSIRARFIGIGGEYYFPDGAVAFKDRGLRLTTPSENTEVIRSMVEIAQARGWDDITVRGTEKFRKEAWFAASLAGISVKGYVPSRFESERMVRAIARRDGHNLDRGREGDIAARFDGAPSRESREGRGDSPGPDLGLLSEKDRARVTASEDPTSPRRDAENATFTGKLVDHGAAPYHHDRKEAMSYFVRLETPSGDKELWGVDLARAVNKSLTGPTMGDEVTVKAVGREAVIVIAEKHDEEGRVVGTEEVSTYRNRWVVEKAGFLAQRAVAARVFRDSGISAEDGAKRHPELTGTYLKLQIAKGVAEKEIAEPTDRRRFVDRMREALALAIEVGEPLQPVRMQDRPPQRAERRQRERNLEPTR